MGANRHQQQQQQQEQQQEQQLSFAKQGDVQLIAKAQSIDRKSSIDRWIFSILLYFDFFIRRTSAASGALGVNGA